MSKLRDWICYMVIIHWPFDVGLLKINDRPRPWRRRLYFWLLPYAGNWAYRNDRP